jgi:hypothetical protein
VRAREKLYNVCVCISLPAGYPQPISDFRWLSREEISRLNICNMDDNQTEGYIIECDLEYPEHLHEEHNVSCMTNNFATSFNILFHSRFLSHLSISPLIRACCLRMRQVKNVFLTARFELAPAMCRSELKSDALDQLGQVRELYFLCRSSQGHQRKDKIQCQETVCYDERPGKICDTLHESQSMEDE